MNARQKAKKLKKELDFIKSQPFKSVYKVINIESEHLRAYRVFPLAEIERFGEDVIEDEARHQLSIEFLKYSTDIWISFGRR